MISRLYVSSCHPIHVHCSMLYVIGVCALVYTASAAPVSRRPISVSGGWLVMRKAISASRRLRLRFSNVHLMLKSISGFISGQLRRVYLLGFEILREKV
jgi:hypothetical protein